MENTNVIAAERHENMNMLSILLEKVQEYDGMVANAKAKQEEIARIDRKLAVPQKTIPLITKIIYIILIGIGWLMLLITYLMNRSAYRKKQEELHGIRSRLQAEYETLRAQIEQYKNDVLDPSIAEYVPERFPKKYAYDAYAIQYMLEAMIDLRADTIKEVINLYAEDMRGYYIMNRLEDISSYTKATAQSTARAALAQEQTAANTAVIAANTGVTATAATATASSMSDIARSQRAQAAAARDQAAAESRVATAAEQIANK